MAATEGHGGGVKESKLEQRSKEVSIGKWRTTKGGGTKVNNRSSNPYVSLSVANFSSQPPTSDPASSKMKKKGCPFGDTLSNPKEATALVVPIVQPSLPKANRFLSDEKVEVEGTPKEENIVDKPDV
ncbi:hypothetical protein HAX54_047329, partial [Datura stramonium]|nr:hypothetical protein [Datura stramonium]